MKQQSKQQSNRPQVQFDPSTLEYYSYLRTVVQAVQMSYWIGNPSVSIINGSITLRSLSIPSQHYQTYEEYLEFIRLLNIQQQNPKDQQEEKQYDRKMKIRSTYLVLCGIPNSKTPVEIIQNSHFGPYRTSLIEIRVIKTVQLRYYAMLLRFKNKQASTSCFNELFGRQYNEIQRQRIIFREMVDITLCFSQIIKDGENNEIKILRKPSEQTETQRMTPDCIFLSSHHLSPKNIIVKAQQTSNNKLSCAICLQEINIQTISILCGHYFHCQCLQRWEFNTCPLCRYHQQPPVISFCQQCNQCEGLWVCLICGMRLCCGSTNDILAQDSHIYQHYKQTNHSLSMQLQTKFIFDARVPAFLHQMFYRDLIQKGAGGQGMTEQPIEKQDMKKNKLSDKISMYENQVAQEMQKQRYYFEESLSKQTKAHRQQIFIKREKAKAMQKQLQSVSKQIEEVGLRNQKLSKQLQQVEKQQKIINNLHKIYSQKVQKCTAKIDKARTIQRNRVLQLQALIEQKKGELLNYKTNLNLQARLKGKLKGEEGSMLLLGDKQKKKKK